MGGVFSQDRLHIQRQIKIHHKQENVLWDLTILLVFSALTSLIFIRFVCEFFFWGGKRKSNHDI